MVECFDLAICILLNSAACFSKKNEFEQVGRICSIILEFSPDDVKALFRRAMAAIELGKSEWAYWDLLLATTIDPGNQEVTMKLEKVKNSLPKARSKKHPHDDIPAGLGVGLSSPRKKANNLSARQDNFEQGDSQGKDFPRLKFDEFSANDTPQGCPSVKGDNTETEVMDAVMDEKMEDVKNDSQI